MILVKHEVKEQNDGFFGMSLCTLGVCLLENLLTGEGPK